MIEVLSPMIEPLYSIPYTAPTGPAASAASAGPTAHGWLLASAADLSAVACACLCLVVLPGLLWRTRGVLAPFWQDAARVHRWLARKVAAVVGVGLAGALVCLGLVAVVVAVVAVVAATMVACASALGRVWRAGGRLRLGRWAMPP
jgi:hypothetical protein